MMKQAKNIQQPQVEAPTEPLVKDLDQVPQQEKKRANKTVAGVYLLLIALGVGTGYLLFSTGPDAERAAKKGEMISTDSVVGIADTQTFSDSAEGTLKQGGINGEGTHQLIREGGSSQTVYLTSSVIDLDEFVGKKVKVWGQTMAAQKAGWLMDVGKIELK